MTNQAVVDGLLAARDRIADGWCQYSVAQDAYGGGTHSEASDAVKWCAFGAVFLIRDAAAKLTANRLLTAAARVIDPGTYSFIHFNDSPDRTKAEMLDMFDIAIRLAKEGDDL